MKHNFDNISKKTDNVRLTSDEKLSMLSNLRQYVAQNPAPVLSPYRTVWFRQSFAYATAFVFLIGSGFTSLAAEEALPGDSLYAIKTSVNEGVVRILPLPTSAKAKVEINMIDRRMEELEKMIVADVDTPEKVDVIMRQIEDHKDEFDTHLAVLTEEVRHEEVDQIHVELETVVDAHIAVLEEITLTDEPEGEPVGDVIPEPDAPIEEVDAPVSGDMYATGPASDEGAATMMMQLKASVPATEEVEPVAAVQVAPVPVRKIDPIVEEVTEFAESEVKPFTQRLRDLTATSSEIQEARAELRERIFRDAERELNIDIDASVEATGTQPVDVGI